MSLLAVVSVVGVIFAFNNSGTQHDAYGNIAVYVDKTDIELDIEVERDEDSDKKLRLADTPNRSTYLTITVGGLPDTADRGVTFNESSARSGVVSVALAGFDQKQGISRFLITGLNGGAPVTLRFTTRSGNQTIAVNVKVNLTAKDFRLSSGAYFGIRQNGAGLDFNKTSTLSKLDFYAHPDDTNQTYKPNNFPLQFALKENYAGVTLNDGVLKVNDDFVFDDATDGREIEVLAKLPTMTEMVSIPVYVFRPVDTIAVTTDAYVPTTTDENIYDLILNRAERSQANFTFALPANQGVVGENYNFKLTPQDTTMINVTNNGEGTGQYVLRAVGNAGRTAVRVTAYPRARMTVDGQLKDVWFNNPDTDANVFVEQMLYLRVRNEFIDQNETGGYVNWKLQYSKEQLSAFYYEGTGDGYTDQFTINTINTQPITYDNDIEFELVVKDASNQTTVFDKDTGLFNVLALSVYRDGVWQPLTSEQYIANYRDQFAVALLNNTESEKYLSGNVQGLWLRAKSVTPLSTSTDGNLRYATWDVPLVAFGAIDRFQISNLTTLDDGTTGVALVHHQGLNQVSAVTLDVYGLLANNDAFEYSEHWDVKAITINDNLPFTVTYADSNVVTSNGQHVAKRAYTFTLRKGTNVEYYNAYPVTFTYPNGISQTIYVKIFPTVTQLNMNVVSDNHGQIYRTIQDDNGYVKTVYVKQGATYRINVATADVSVGAYAEIGDQGEKSFDARELAEGCYTVPAYLHAYSDDVYVNHEQRFTVNFVVVAPVVNVAAPSTITLPGIGPSVPIKVAPTSGSEQYLHVDPVLQNENIDINRITTTEFTLSARYLKDEPITIGFRIYKQYNFGIDFDGDGIDDVFEIQYTAGNLVPITVTIANTNRFSQVIINEQGAVRTEKGIGKYIELVSKPLPETPVSVKVTTLGTSSCDEIGFTFIKYQNGKFDITDRLDNINVITAAEVQGNSLLLTPKAEIRSMGIYALLVYTKDSLRLGATVTGKVVEIPQTYEIVPLYIGTQEEIENVIGELKDGIIHDGNSGQLNDLGGYNWVMAGEKPYHAALFYTVEGTEYSSNIKANRYYLDDLELVLGSDEKWQQALCFEEYEFHKFVNNVEIKDLNDEEKISREGLSKKTIRKYFQVGDYSYAGHEVYYLLSNGNGVNLYFYVAESIKHFDVRLTVDGSSSIVAEKSLTTGSMNSELAISTVKVQRGRPFRLVGETDASVNSFWQIDPSVIDNPAGPSYMGGSYQFMPYLEFDDGGGAKERFNLTVLQTLVKVGITGGVQYLSLAQSGNTLDGVTTAVYNATVLTDQSWDKNILNYVLDYNGVRYQLFENAVGDIITDEVLMEGGNAAFYFKLIPTKGKLDINTNYYTHYLRLEVAIILKSAATNPFANVSGARLILQENLSGSTLEGSKVAREVSAGLNVVRQGITNVSMAHFANITVDTNTGNISLPESQSNTNIIYVDNSVVGGILTVHPSPYYLDVDSIAVECVKPVEVTKQIGTSLDGVAVMGTARYSIGFMQLVYNTDEQVYQNFLSGTSPKMVSTWSKKDGYQWNGRYYFRTYLRCDGQADAAIPDGAEFKIAVTITSEGYQRITEQMTIYAKYKDGIVITPDDNGTAYPISTMVQTNYQAVGTSAVYDIAFPAGYLPNYLGYSIYGDGKDYATVEVDALNKTVRVRLASDVSLINKTIEIRFPYRAQGDFVNPYLSVVIVPVYFQFTGLSVANHIETPVILLADESPDSLTYRVIANYDSSLAVITSRLSDFNGNLGTKRPNELLQFTDEGHGKRTVRFSYSYVNGIPVIMRDGELVYEQTIYYEVAESRDILERTVYLAIGCTETYDFEFDPLRKQIWRVASRSGAATDLWDVNMRNDNSGIFTVSLNNEANGGLDLINAPLTLEIGPRTSSQVDLRLHIVPVYFTFNGFKTLDYPVDPLIALSQPFTVTLAADNVVTAGGEKAVTALAEFNADLLQAQEDADKNLVNFARVPNEEGIINFDFDETTRALSRNDLNNPITATTHLQASATIIYRDGRPELNKNGQKMTTYFVVKTYGSNPDGGNENENPLEPQPSSRYRKVAQAIGTSVTYNIALKDVTFDTVLDCSETSNTTNPKPWSSDSKWTAKLSGNKIIVDLQPNTDLFGLTLVINVYSAEDNTTPVYTLNIVPAYFTVENLVAVGHADENPLQIISPETIDTLRVDFESVYGNLDYPYLDKIAAFRETLLHTELLTRIADGGLLTLLLGVRYNNGEPEIVSRANSSALTVQSTYRYELLANGPKVATLAQAIGTTIQYDRIPYGKTIRSISRCYYDPDNREADEEGYVELTSRYDADKPYTQWDAYISNNDSRLFQVSLANTTDLFNYRLKVEVYTVGGKGTSTPDCKLYIIPAQFVLSGLAVDGQSGNEIWFVADSTPVDANALINNISYVGVVDSRNLNGSNIAGLLTKFNTEQLRQKADLLERNFDSDATTGKLTTTMYLKYVNGEPTLVATKNEADICLPTDFTYQIYGPSEYNPNYPNLPTGPRTRSEVQAIGTTVRYHIDLPTGQLIDKKTLEDSSLEDSSADKLWTATWEDEELVVTLKPNTKLLNNTIKLSFYSMLDHSANAYLFELTIRPVLFEVVGFTIADHPEQPVTLLSADDKANLAAVVKHMDIYQTNGDTTYNAAVSFLRQQLAKFNQQTLASYVKNGNTQFWQVDDEYDSNSNFGYLTFRAAINYNDRNQPRLVNIDSNPLSVVESTVAYQMVASADEIGSTAAYYQAIGTTEFYPLPASVLQNNRFKAVSGSGASVDASGTKITATYWQASIVNSGDRYAVKVEFNATQYGTALLGTDIILEIVDANPNHVFTLQIKPVYFVVEGFEVVNHPERPLWLLTSPETTENVSSLRFNAKVRRSYAPDLQADIDVALNVFNNKLQNDWYNDLEISAVGGEYLLVRGAVAYNTETIGEQLGDGSANLVPIVTTGLERIPLIRSIFQYKIYNNSGTQLPDTGIVYPTGTRTRTVAQAIGLTNNYTIDLADLPNFGTAHLTLTEERQDGTKSDWTATSGWQVTADGNSLTVSLAAASDLLERTLVITISYNADYYNPAYVLKIKPVWFKVVDIAMQDHPESPIIVDDLNNYARPIFVPVVEYAPELTDEVSPKVTAFVKKFTNNMTSVLTTSRRGSDGKTEYIRCTAFVGYDYPDVTNEDETLRHDGVYLSNNIVDRLWRVFTVQQKDEGQLTPKPAKTVVQGIGSTKEYYLELSKSVNNGTYPSNDGKATAVVKGDQTTVTLAADTDLIGRTLVFDLGGAFDLKITPVWFEVKKLEVVGHPERPVWLFSPATTASLNYRAVTNAIPAELGIEEKIAAFNTNLNAQRATLVSESVSDKYITINAAVDYVDGLPTLVRIGGDLSNVVETVFEYYVWADSREPTPEHPAVIATTKVNQIIGGSKTYTLQNIQGKVYYQWLWVEGAGQLKQANNGSFVQYEGVTVNFDVTKNLFTVAIAADVNYLLQPIKINLPYLVTVDKQEVWYTHCLEITPLLLEVYGWQIKPDATAPIAAYECVGDYLKLNIQNLPLNANFVPKVNYSSAAELAPEIEQALAALQEQIDADLTLLNWQYQGDYVQISANNNKLVVMQNTTETQNTAVDLTGRIVYENGRPTAEKDGGISVANQVMVSTGNPQPWPPEEPLVGHQTINRQAIGTEYIYHLDFVDADYLLNDAQQPYLDVQYDQMRIMCDGVVLNPQKDYTTDNDDADDNRFVIDGEYDLLTVDYDADAQNVIVDLAAVLALTTHSLTIDIPYKVDTNYLDPDSKAPVYATKYYRLAIDPVSYLLNGFTLVGHVNNYVALNDQDVQVTLQADVTRTDRATNAVRNSINMAIDNFENQLKTMLQNQNLDDAWTITNLDGTVNNYIDIVTLGGSLWLQRTAPVTASHRVTTRVYINYQDGRPVLSEASKAELYFDVEILVDTDAKDVEFFPGLDDVKEGERREFQQAVGTSKTYVIDKTANATETLYFKWLTVKNGGPKRDAKNYEFFDMQITGGSNYGEIVVTFKPQVRLLINPLEILIPYAKYQTADGQEGDVVWYYYALVIKPVLFEVTGWGVENEKGEVVDELIIDDSAVELKFVPIIRSAPLDNQTFVDDPSDPNNAETSELIFISNSIRNLKKQINDYNAAVADKYTYLVINNYPEENHQINYSLYRDEGAQKTYLIRDVNEDTYTTIDLSATISYQVNSFDTSAADGVHAVVGYDDLNNGIRVSSSVTIKTTDRTKAGNENLMVITQDNAKVLESLAPDTDYILMEDIHLSRVSASGWQPAVFPTNSTLDGNNFKIYLDAGFDLSKTPGNIGLFESIPNGSVVKNLQVVIPQGTSFDKARTLEVDLTDYNEGAVNIGLLAGTNNGLITNCAVLSDWQFVQDLSNVINPLSGNKFTSNLQFNMEGYLFGTVSYDGVEDTYFFETSINSNQEITIERVYNRYGYRLIKNGANKWVEYVDKYNNNIEFITPDTTSVARYDNYSAMMSDGSAAARVLVKGTNAKLDVTLGGLVGTNARMVTNSRVLIDVELTDLNNGADNVDDAISANSAIVGGFVGNNGKTGTITASFFRDGNVINNANVSTASDNPICYLGGFVGYNQGKILQSYAMGQSTNRDNKANINFTSLAGSVKTSRNSLGGFVHQNDGTVTDCLVNMLIDKGGLAGFAGGFVYRNTTNGKITNCVENNVLYFVAEDASGALYRPFIALNANMTVDDAKAGTNTVLTNLQNLYYAGNLSGTGASQFLAPGVLTQLADVNDPNANSRKYNMVESYEGFSIGENNNADWYITAQNTIWMMTDLGPMLRTPNDIAISYRKTIAQSSPYLFAPGTARNPYLIWQKDQFRSYVYAATPSATKADKTGAKQNVDANRQNNHLRLVDDVTLDGIQDTYKITYTGTFEGNGLTLGGIGLPSVATTLVTAGLFGKTEYATIRNINFTFNNNINSTARYVGGIAGISINTNYVDVNLNGSSSTILGANIVGGVAGLMVVNDYHVENYNINSSISVRANYSEGITSPGSSRFTSGEEYVRQTLYSRVEYHRSPREQAFGTAGGVFGFVTANPNNYKVFDNDGNASIKPRKAESRYETLDEAVTLTSFNTDATMFMRDRNGNAIDDTGIYYTDQIVLRNISGKVGDIAANVAGGLIGIMDETIELHEPTVASLNKLTGKYYLGGVVGINLGKISGGTIGQIAADGTVNSLPLNVNSSVTGSYIYRFDSNAANPKHYWGMTVGAVAAYNNGLADNNNSGTIENVNVNVNMLNGSAQKIYVIGGVIGEAGTYSTISNTVNNIYATGANTVMFSASEFNKIGFYVGKIVGRAVIDPNNVRSNMVMMPASVDIVYQDCYVSLTDFATPNYKVNNVYTNAFGIQADENGNSITHKVQTMTMDEYQQYIVDSLVRGNATIAQLVTALEPWYRSLPTYIVNTTINGKNVFVEKLTALAYTEFVNWLTVNKVFDRFTAYKYNGVDNTGATVTKNRLLNDYCAYVEYCAIGKVDEGEVWFNENLVACRNQRYQLAEEFFAYKSQAADNSTQYPATIRFTWQQYENYRYLLASLNMKQNEYYKRTYGDEILKYDADLGYLSSWLANKDLPELGATDDYGTVKLTDGYADLQALLNHMVTENADGTVQVVNRFTEKDPLQAYMNYITDGYTYRRTLGSLTENITHEQYGTRGSGWYMTLKQYFHYVNDIAGETYGDRDHQGKYDVDLIADYLYSSYTLNQAASPAITLDEYMVFRIDEAPILRQNELEWVEKGHQKGGVTVSLVGALTMPEWGLTDTKEEAWQALLADTENVKLVAENGEIVYTNNQDGAAARKVWAYQTAYTAARAQGIDIIKYQEMCRLGGSLYELTHSKKEDGVTLRYATVDEYLFALKVPQYGWSDAQSAFISGTFGIENIRYALSATYYGNILQQTLDKVMAIKAENNPRLKHKFQNKAEGWVWYYDDDNNDSLDSGVGVKDRRGTWQLIAADNFHNGDGEVYEYVNPGQAIDLRENTNSAQGPLQGAALYIDADDDKLFTTDVKGVQELGSGDTLVLYEVPTVDGADFKQLAKDDDGNPLAGQYKYFKISRRIIEQGTMRYTTTNGRNEYSGNTADYLEEALWWQNQGFTEEQFDQIKANAMQQSVPYAGQVVLTKEPGTNHYTVADRGVGFVVADDWYAKKGGEEYGFRTFNFTTTDYTNIATNAHYTTLTNQDTGETKQWWYSNYADYLLFCGLLNMENTTTGSTTSDIDSIAALAARLPYPDNNQTIWNTASTSLPDRTNYVNYPFVRRTVKELSDDLISENDLAAAMEFGSDQAAYLQLLATKHTTADYVTWAFDNKTATTLDNKNKYFRMNHYLYLQTKNKGDELTGDNLKNFVWALNQNNRAKIYYTGVTQESRTDELLAYREEWWNHADQGNTPYMTFRDYQEWINVYAHGDEYKIDRGELAEGEEATAEAWLDIYAFAVWKRMEKYENNVEYINKGDQSSGITQITNPILKRQISTTVFPKIASSGNGSGPKPTLPVGYWWEQDTEKEKDGSVKKDNDGNPILKWEDKDKTKPVMIKVPVDGAYYGWPEDKEPPKERVRPYYDRYEYNEKYLEGYRDVNDPENLLAYTVYDFDKGTFNPDNIYSLLCDDKPVCKHPEHAKFQSAQWLGRYTQTTYVEKQQEKKDANGNVVKDENGKPVMETVMQEKKDADGNVVTDENGNTVMEPVMEAVVTKYDGIDRMTDKAFTQLYVPFDYFKRACQMIQSVYSADNQYAGYHNFMHYWAKNGKWNWICFTTDGGTLADDDPVFEQVDYTYRATNFWNNFDPSQGLHALASCNDPINW